MQGNCVTHCEGLLDGVSPVVELDPAEESVVGVDGGELVIERAKGEIRWAVRIGVEEGGVVVVVVPRTHESGGVERSGRQSDFGRKHKVNKLGFAPWFVPLRARERP